MRLYDIKNSWIPAFLIDLFIFNILISRVKGYQKVCN